MVPANLRRTNNFSLRSHLRRTEESMAEADWSQLPKELLQLISEVFLASPNKAFFSSNHPQHQTNKKTPLHPWLIKIGPNLNGKTHLSHPLDINQTSSSCFPYPYDVIDFNKLLVLQLGDAFYIHHLDLRPNRSHRYIHYEKVVVATSEGGQPIALLTYNYQNMPTIFHCGDDSWNNIPAAMSRPLCGDICVFKGRLCVTDGDGRTVMIGPDSTVHLLANPVFTNSFGKLLVENECELLLVDLYGFGRDDDHLRIHVFRLDEKEKKWVRLTDLGDRVLFLGGDRSFCVSASDLCVANGNCVIYCRSYGCFILVFRVSNID